MIDKKTGAKARGSDVFPLIHVGELLRMRKAPEQQIDKLIPAGAMVGIVAPPASAKSVLASHWAGCIATGNAFLGRKCKRGLVVYLWGEAQLGAALRFHALEQHHRLGLHDAPLVLSKVATSLLDWREVLRVKCAIEDAQRRYEAPLAQLVVDTAARFITPGDESKAQDMSTFIAAVDTLRESASAVICHHPGHGDPTRGRGSSSWRAALDVEYTLAKRGDVVTMTCQKMKDGETPQPLSFRLQPVDTLMTNEEGRTATSVVLTECGSEAASSQPSGKNQLKLLGELRKAASVQPSSACWSVDVALPQGKGYPPAPLPHLKCYP